VLPNPLMPFTFAPGPVIADARFGGRAPEDRGACCARC
jgi:hypothetical protein